MPDESPRPDAAPRIGRRAFVAGAIAAGLGVAGASAALVRMTRKAGRPLAGGFVEDGSEAGHRLRDGGAWPVVREERRTSVVVVGGGMAGLSAAWWLDRKGLRDVAVLELQSAAGGNSRAGESPASAYPWGAHYVPVPNPRAEWVRLLFEEMGVLAADGSWREEDLCHAPKERTFAHGRWHEGLAEAVAAGAADHEELRRFADHLVSLRATGEFTIPLALGGAGSAGSPLDRLTIAAWLDANGYRGRAIHWLADYACRDDFGTAARDTSAWAALHYFAARDGDEEGPLTWPEGNGRIVRHLLSRVGARVHPSAPVHRVQRAAPRASAPMHVFAGGVRWTCDAVVWAAPTFLASRVVDGAPRTTWDHAPWMVANLHLDRLPAERGDGFPPAWDNVIADSRALGYVVATHQQLRERAPASSVWTHYTAPVDEPPSAARRRLLSSDWRSCAEAVLRDLERVHPDLRDCVTRVDVRRYGHAMPRPTPGFLAERVPWWRVAGEQRVFWGNSDISGLSLFEEAQYRGIVAAEGALGVVGRG